VLPRLLLMREGSAEGPDASAAASSFASMSPICSRAFVGMRGTRKIVKSG
jgi:hypothetical protein